MKFVSANITDQPKAKWDIMFPLMVKTFPIMNRASAKLITKAEARAMGDIYVFDRNEDHLILVINEHYREYTKTWDNVFSYFTDTWEGIRIGFEMPKTNANKELLGLIVKPKKLKAKSVLDLTGPEMEYNEASW